MLIPGKLVNHVNNIARALKTLKKLPEKRLLELSSMLMPESTKEKSTEKLSGSEKPRSLMKLDFEEDDEEWDGELEEVDEEVVDVLVDEELVDTKGSSMTGYIN